MEWQNREILEKSQNFLAVQEIGLKMRGLIPTVGTSVFKFGKLRGATNSHYNIFFFLIKMSENAL